MARTGTIDLNRCTAQELADANIAQVSQERAQKLVDYRDENGPFESWDEVKDVPGFSDEMVENLQEAGVTLGGMDEE